MPKHNVESWSCDICRALFGYKDHAIACENFHAKQGKIIYTAHGQEKKYPHIVSVEFKDGTVIDYYS